MHKRDVALNDVLETISGFQKAALDFSEWPSAMKQLNRLFDYNSPVLQWGDSDSLHNGGLVIAPSMDTKILSDYMEMFIRSSTEPRVNQVLSSRVGEIMSECNFITESEINKSEYYDWLNSVSGCRYCLGATLYDDSETRWTFSLQAESDQTAPGQDEIDLMKVFLPHMQLAMETSVRHRHNEQLVTGLLSALNTNDCAVALINQQGKFITTNDGMNCLLAKADLLYSFKGEIYPTSQKNRSLFNREFTATLKSLHNPSFYQSSGFFLQSVKSGSTYHCHFSPMPASAAGTQPVVMLQVEATERDNPLTQAMVCDCFGLSKAQATLVILLCEGADTRQAAARLNISWHTVRNHLKAIFKKLRVNSQKDLVGLVKSSLSHRKH